MKEGYYYIVNSSGLIVWVYLSCGLALMDLTSMWANGLSGLAIVYNGSIIYRLTDEGIDKVI